MDFDLASTPTIWYNRIIQLYYDNNSASEADVVMLDIMPYSGVNGSNFTGEYSVNSWKLDVSKCDYAKLMFRYTMNEEYKNATTESLYGNEAAKTIYHGRLPTAYRCSVCSAAKIYQAQKTKSAKCLMRL